MPHEFACVDAGAKCDARFRARSEDEVMAEVERHLEEVHEVQPVSETIRSYVRTLVR